IEFAVQMVCGDCEQRVKKALDNVEGINNVTINRDQEQVIVETTLPSSHIQALLEKTGKKVALTGQSAGDSNHLGAAVVILEAGNSLIKGVVRFIQSDQNKCIIEGTIDGLPEGHHSVCIHQYGDISLGCKSCGPVFGNLGLKEKVSIVTELKVGELGRGEFRIENKDVKVWDIIGRSLVVHQGKYFLDTDTDKRLSCGIIARSAGIFENSKKICTCDGTTIWDETEKAKKTS
ncbi:hypothetical protein LOTGIDRAFT_107910, partial [Lottia gigantea]